MAKKKKAKKGAQKKAQLKRHNLYRRRISGPRIRVSHEKQSSFQLGDNPIIIPRSIAKAIRTIYEVIPKTTRRTVKIEGVTVPFMDKLTPPGTRWLSPKMFQHYAEAGHDPLTFLIALGVMIGSDQSERLIMDQLTKVRDSLIKSPPRQHALAIRLAVTKLTEIIEKVSA